MLNVYQLLERLTEEYQVTANHVLRGLCPSMEDYRAKCARLRTLEDVDAIAKVKDKKLNEGPLNEDSRQID